MNLICKIETGEKILIFPLLFMVFLLISFLISNYILVGMFNNSPVKWHCNAVCLGFYCCFVCDLGYVKNSG